MADVNAGDVPAQQFPTKGPIRVGLMLKVNVVAVLKVVPSADHVYVQPDPVRCTRNQNGANVLPLNVVLDNAVGFAPTNLATKRCTLVPSKY